MTNLLGGSDLSHNRLAVVALAVGLVVTHTASLAVTHMLSRHRVDEGSPYWVVSGKPIRLGDFFRPSAYDAKGKRLLPWAVVLFVAGTGQRCLLIRMAIP